MRLAWPGLTHRENICLLLFLTLSIYLIKLLHSPDGFTLFDEFLHWRTAHDIAQTGHLFQDNSMLPVSPLYPGLEIATNTLMTMGGLSIFHAGAIVIGVARLVMVLALYHLYDEVGQSTRVAAIATALYLANPNFTFFDGQYGYESLALPFMALVLFALIRYGRGDLMGRSGHLVAAIIAVLAVVTTHHVTSYALAAILIGLVLFRPFFARWPGNKLPGLGLVTLITIVASLTWLLTVANITIGYLSPNISEMWSAIIRVLSGEGMGRQLFQSATGQVAPLWERATGLASTFLICVGILIGLVIWWRECRKAIILAVLAICALAYPATLALRLIPAGWEIGMRLGAFIFIGVALILALGLKNQAFVEGRGWLSQWLLNVLLAMFVGIIFAGSIIAGQAPWSRLPWPYMVGADSRSIESEGIAAAEWALLELGPNNRMAADRTNTVLMGSYGKQRMIVNLKDKVSISGIFLSPELGEEELALLKKAQIRYLVVDRRLSSQLPMEGFYYEEWEKLIVPYEGTIDPKVLEKFSSIPNVNKVFDNGSIAIYDVGALWNDQ